VAQSNSAFTRAASLAQLVLALRRYTNLFIIIIIIITARCYASAVLAMGLCLCPSVTSRSSIETVERIGLVFGMGASFDLSYTVF